jgi:hypothetical protein
MRNPSPEISAFGDMTAVNALAAHHALEHFLRQRIVKYRVEAQVPIEIPANLIERVRRLLQRHHDRKPEFLHSCGDEVPSSFKFDGAPKAEWLNLLVGGLTGSLTWRLAA